MNTNKKTNTSCLSEVKSLTLHELGIALYHISQNTETSRQYTLEFVSGVALRASEVLLNQKEVPEDVSNIKTPSELYDEYAEEEFNRIMRHMPTTWCIYHNQFHFGESEHQCPLNNEINCGCCASGFQSCLRRTGGERG